MSESSWGWTLFIITAVILGIVLSGMDSSSKKVADCSAAIIRANSTIEDMNATISDAKDSQWSSYADMGDAIESLEEGGTVSNPCLPV